MSLQRRITETDVAWLKRSVVSSVVCTCRGIGAVWKRRKSFQFGDNFSPKSNLAVSHYHPLWHSMPLTHSPPVLVTRLGQPLTQLVFNQLIMNNHGSNCGHICPPTITFEIGYLILWRPNSELDPPDASSDEMPKSDTTIDEKPEDNLWLQLGFTVDSETGEHLLSPKKNISGGDVTLDSVSPLNSPSFTLNETVPDFNLDFNLDEALKFVGLNCSETGETVWKPSEPEPTSDNKESPGKEEEDSEDSLDTLNDTLDDMIQASQLHPQHPCSLQKHNHLGGAGYGVMESDRREWCAVIVQSAVRSLQREKGAVFGNREAETGPRQACPVRLTAARGCELVTV
ncbi:hypothetical protein O3P69_014568 [Scylla paramamosain]|uniref:Uncharacterized protein n=1 Tax=Scylla paramamosain TaxID=85552 RepID=A0AAW0SDA2_SCYPA